MSIVNNTSIDDWQSKETRSTSTEIHDLRVGQSYAIRVRTIGHDGSKGEWQTLNCFNVTRLQNIPDPPTNVTATLFRKEIRVSWTNPTTNTDATELTDLGSIILYSNTEDVFPGPTGSVLNLDPTQWNDSGQIARVSYDYRWPVTDSMAYIQEDYSTNYYYWLVAEDKAGNISTPVQVMNPNDPLDPALPTSEDPFDVLDGGFYA